MSDCDRIEPLMQGLIDDELDAANVVRLESHIADCRRCSDELNRLMRISDIVRASAVRHRTPGRLRRRIEDSLDLRETTARPGRKLDLAVSAICGALAASLGLVLAVPMQIRPPIEREIVANHVRSLLSDHLTDVKTSNQHRVRPWFNGRINYSPTTPDLVSFGYPLVGGRLDYLDGKVVSALVYRRNLHTINVFVWPASPQGGSLAQQQGYTIVEWSDDGLRYAAVSDLPEADLQVFRERFKASQGRN